MLAMSGCATQKISSPVHLAAPLSRATKVFICVPENGKFEKITYPNSGRQTALALAEQASKRFSGVELSRGALSEEEAIKAATEAKCAYVLEAIILHWEDRATEWSGRPDRLQIELHCVDVASGKAVDVSSLEAQTGIFGAMGHEPQDFLPALFADYCDRLFR